MSGASTLPRTVALPMARDPSLALVGEGLLGLLLFGDWLALTVARALVGQTGWWLQCIALLQPLVIAALLALGGGRVVSRAQWLGHVGLCVIGFAHAIPVWVAGNELSEYAFQKLLVLPLLLGPALWCGMLVGERRVAPAARALPWYLTPLLLLCGIALLTDPRLLTIEYFAEPPVFFGFLVMPTHQPLAYELAKAALLMFALHQTSAPNATGRLPRLAAVGGLAGLVLVTGARSYAAALVAGLAMQSWLAGRRAGLLWVGAAVAAVLYQGYAAQVVHDRFDPTQILQSLAYLEREQSWIEAWDAFTEHWLFGTGPGNYGTMGGWYGRVYPHNLLLEVAAEFGVVGCGCLLALFAPAVGNILRSLRRRERPSPAGAFACGMLVFGVVGSLAVGDLIRNYFVWFALGMCATALAPTAAPRPRGGQP